ncbi:MAG TPA: DUF2764 family protein [Kiritimatiellia bacterium]|nr:DUF2764 family protein [Kiritimatiellia bacterium]HRU70444.1 DUF2764 family protein [Kiritimatiellia bacterium]
MSVIYLLSSLPMLRLDAPSAVTPEAFLSACRDQLSAADAAAAEALLTGAACDHPFVAAWRDRDTILRNAVARQRARLAGDDASRWLRPASGCDTRIETQVEEAFNQPDPLRREKALDQIRWMIAEELQGPDPLDVKGVFAYAVKLAILARWAALTPEQGQNTFDRLTEIPLTFNSGD